MAVLKRLPNGVVGVDIIAIGKRNSVIPKGKNSPELLPENCTDLLCMPDVWNVTVSRWNAAEST